MKETAELAAEEEAGGFRQLAPAAPEPTARPPAPPATRGGRGGEIARESGYESGGLRQQALNCQCRQIGLAWPGMAWCALSAWPQPQPGKPAPCMGAPASRVAVMPHRAGVPLALPPACLLQTRRALTPCQRACTLPTTSSSTQRALPAVASSITAPQWWWRSRPLPPTCTRSRVSAAPRHGCAVLLCAAQGRAGQGRAFLAFWLPTYLTTARCRLPCLCCCPLRCRGCCGGGGLWGG
jgi:hypothetical protein